MNIRPMKPENVDVSKINFSDLKTLDNGAKLIYMNYGKVPIYIQTPEFDIPFDTGSFYEDKPGTGKFAVKVSLNGHDSDKKVKSFHDMLEKIDQYLIESAVKHGAPWFKKPKLTSEVASELYTKMLKVSVDDEGEPDGRYPPSFSFKIVKRDGKVLCKVFDEEQNEVNVDNSDEDGYIDLENSFKKNTKVKMLLKCNGIWIASGKFGYTWRAEQIRIKVPPSFDNYAFIPSDDEDDREEVTKDGVSQKDFIESSESSDDDEDVVVKKPSKSKKM